LSSSTPSICTISGSTVRAVAPGTCTIAADQGGNASYNAAAQVTQNITVAQASQSIGAISFTPSTLAVGGTSTASATASSGLAVTFASTTPSTCTISGSTVSAVAPGTCTIAADQGGNASYNAAAQTSETITVDPSTTIALNLVSGWNLIGNSLNQTVSVPTVFSDMTLVTTVWKWDTSLPGWQFYTPQMDAPTLLAYASARGYGVLGTINPGEGYWVNAKVPTTIHVQPSAAFNLTASHLTAGWNLVATGNNVTPSAFNLSLSETPPSPGTIPINLTTLWAWDATLSQWYFYAPSLEANAGLGAYTAGKGYLDFGATGKTLGNGVGFWVNRP
jgi:hypothetical protein